MSTRESVAPRETQLLRPAVTTGARSSPLYAKFLAWAPLNKMVYLVSDLAALSLAHLFATGFVEHFLGVPMSALSHIQYHRYYIPFFAVILSMFDGYKSAELRRPEQELERSCKAVAVSFLGLVLFNFIVFRSESFSRYLLTVWFVLACMLLVAFRFILRSIYVLLWKAGLCRQRAVLVGSAAALSDYRELLSTQRHEAYDVIGVLVDSPVGAASAANIPYLRVLGAVDDWEQVLLDTNANVLVVALSAIRDSEEWLGELLCRCKEMHVDVELFSGVMATANMSYQHDEFSGCSRFYGRSEWSIALQRALKKAIDLGAGLIGGLITVMLMPAVWLLINSDERGPLFYRSAYVGQDGGSRYYLKFRTMHVDADRVLETDAVLRARFREQQKLIDDPRVTRVGRILRKFSLDEFPQFFSILIGDLTLVGPRTIRREEAARYGPQLQKLLSVKPGVTGFWQVMGRQTTTYDERVRMDMFYIDRWSIWLDLIIIGKTLWKVLKAEGAY